MNVRARLCCGGVLAAVLLVFGCSTKTKSPVAPSSSSLLDAAITPDGSSLPGGFETLKRRDIGAGGSRFFPLDSGSVWIYTLDQSSVLVNPPEPPDSFVDHGSVTTRMLGELDFSGTPYTRSTETTRIRDDREFEREIFYRQDATGLYELDLPIRDPLAGARVSRMHRAFAARIAGQPAAARPALLRALANLESKLTRVEQMLHSASGPLPETGPQGQPEIQRLAYPLALGRQWIVRATPLFTERVEAREAVLVGGQRLAAWRIRIESELFGPDDRVWLWMSHEGELRFRYRLVGENTDIEGNPAGTLITELDQLLVEYHLVNAPPQQHGPLGFRTFGDLPTPAGAPRAATR